MKQEIKYPKCECDGWSCCGGVGPAVYSVIRDGKKMKLCTRCDLSTDQDRKILPWVKKAPADLFFKFDAIGALSLGFQLSDEKKKK